MLTRLKHAAFLFLLCVDTNCPRLPSKLSVFQELIYILRFNALLVWLACNENHYETIMLISWTRRYLSS